MNGQRFTGLAALLLAGLFALAGAARADSLGDAFLRGNAAFARGEHERAVREYEALLEAGVRDPDLSFNVASAYGALGRYGQAIRHFERALRFDPRDSAARDGLRLARDALGERQAQAHGEAIVVDRPALSEALFAFFSEDGLAWLLLLSVWSGTALWVLLPRMRVEVVRLGVGIAAALSFACALFGALGLAAKADWGRDGERAIILREAVALREGPDDKAQLSAQLTEGEPVRLLAREGRFARVAARGARTGYVRAEDVGEI